MQIIKNLNNWLTNIFLSQQYCVLCGSKCRSQQVCQPCYSNLMNIPSVYQNRCWKCLITKRAQQLECDNCRENKFVFDRIITAFDYGYPIEQILHKLKYSNNLAYSTFLSQIFWSRISKQITHLPDAIIPVPLHPNKQKTRGFNQTHELVRELCATNPQVQFINAIRTKETTQQAKLNRISRVANMKDAFQINNDIRGLNISIIDDVITTGSTINELAKLCKNLGAARVEIWSLMRTQY